MRKGSPTFFPALLVCGALAATGVFHAWQRVEGLRLGYRLGEVTAEHRALLSANEHLRLEVAMLKAPSRIERMARDHFGMAPPRPSQVIVIQEVPAGFEGSPTPDPPDLKEAAQTSLAGGRPEGKPLSAIMARLGAREEATSEIREVIFKRALGAREEPRG